MSSPPFQHECEDVKEVTYWLLKALLLLIVPVARSDCNNLKAQISLNNFSIFSFYATEKPRRH
jgi:putative effector of murein hydrolase LrgA (UPF0299 family)